MLHYAFVNGEVHGPTEWALLIGVAAVGTFTYTPTERDPWARIIGPWGRWEAVGIEDIPAEFRLQLLLLGVPT